MTEASDATRLPLALQDFHQKAIALADLSRLSLNCQDVSVLRSRLCDLNIAKRSMLESSAFTLQEGDALLEKLSTLWQLSSLDSRPGIVKQSVALAIGQVELWLEELHDKRVAVTDLFQLRLEELQELLDATSDLSQIESLLRQRKAFLESLRDLGSSAASCDDLIRGTMTLQSESQDIYDRCSKVARCSHPSAESAALAYAVLEQAADYQRLLDARIALLTQTADFFTHAQNASYRLEQMEREVSNADPVKSGGAVRQLLTDILQDLANLVGEVDRRSECIAADASDDGGAGAGAGAASAGVRAVASQVRSKADNIATLAELKRSQASRGGEALQSFARKLEEVDEWTNAVVVEFLMANSSLGTSHELARKFLERHRELVNKIHMKTFELEGLRGVLKTVADQCSNEETKNVERRMDASNKKLTELMADISKRLAVSEQLVKFLKLFEQVQKELGQMEGNLSRTGGQSLEWSDYGESWLCIQQLLTQFSHVGKNCTEDMAGADGDEYLDKGSATALIEKCIARINQTQNKVSDLRKGHELRSQEGKRLDEEWDSIDREKRESIHFSASIDGELFPMVNPEDVHQPDIVCRKLEEKMSVMSKHDSLLPVGRVPARNAYLRPRRNKRKTRY